MLNILFAASQIYEMITGEMLFNPGQEKYRYTKEDDLLGQQIEIRKFTLVCSTRFLE